MKKYLMMASLLLSGLLLAFFVHAADEPLDSTAIGPNNRENSSLGQILIWYASDIFVEIEDNSKPNKDDTCVVAQNGSKNAVCGANTTPQLSCALVGVDRQGSDDYNLSIITTIHPACIDSSYSGGYRVVVNGYGLGDADSDSYRGVHYTCTITCVMSPVYDPYCQGQLGYSPKC